MRCGIVGRIKVKEAAKHCVAVRSPRVQEAMQASQHASESVRARGAGPGDGRSVDAGSRSESGGEHVLYCVFCTLSVSVFILPQSPNCCL